MLPLYLQSRSTAPGTTGPTLALAYSGAVQRQSLLVAGIFWNRDASQTVTVADSVNSSWTALGTPFAAAGVLVPYHIQMFYFSGTGAGTPTVTATFSANISNGGLAIHEYSGIDIGNPIDQAAVYNNIVSATPASTGFATSFEGLLFSMCITGDGQPGAGTGYNKREATNFQDNCTIDLSVANGGIYTPNYTQTSADTCIGAVAFKSANVLPPSSCDRFLHFPVKTKRG